MAHLLHKMGTAGVMLLLASLATSGQIIAEAEEPAPEPVDLGINVVMARDMGCTNDHGSWFGPFADLRITIYLDDAKVFQTAKASDMDNPHFAQATVLRQVTPPAKLSIQIEEAEPGGFFGTGTSWVECDAHNGDGTRHSFVWSEGVQEVVTRGNATRSAEATVVVGTEMPSPPEIIDLRPRHHHAEIDWVPGDNSSGAATMYSLGWFAAPSESVPIEDGTHWVEGLRDNSAYSLRWFHTMDPWVVAGPVQRFTTENAPPPPFAVEDVRRSENTTYDVKLGGDTPHDAQRWEFHAGAGADFVVTNSSYRVTGASRSGEGEPFRAPYGGYYPIPHVAGDAYVRVVTYDFGGLNGTSAAATIPDWAPPHEPAAEEQTGNDNNGTTSNHGPSEESSADSEVQNEPSSSSEGGNRNDTQEEPTYPDEQGNGSAPQGNTSTDEEDRSGSAELDNIDNPEAGESPKNTGTADSEASEDAPFGLGYMLLALAGVVVLARRRRQG